jgi:hypothetical protein
MRNRSEQLLVRVGGRAAELKDRRVGLGSLHDPGNRFRNIFHIGRLQSGPAAAEHRIDWKPTKELEDGAEKRVVRSEHHSRADEKCIGEFRADRLFAFAALSDVAGWRGGIRTDPRNVNKPFDSSPVGLGCYPLSLLDVNGVKSLRSALAIKADRVYNAVGADQRIRDGSLVVNVGLYGLKLRILRTRLAVSPVRMP